MHLYSKWPKELSARISSSFLFSTGNLNQHNPPPKMKFSPLNCSSRPPPHVGCNQLTLVSCFLPSHRRTKLAKLTQINRWANLASHGRSERVKYEAEPGLFFLILTLSLYLFRRFFPRTAAIFLLSLIN